MALFAMMCGATLLLWAAHRVGAPGLEDWPARMRWALAAAMLFAGIDHLVTPGRYLAMMPAWVPWHREMVALTGVAEIAGALGLLIPATRRLAGLMLGIYFVCVFPANVQNAVDGLSVDGLPQAAWYYWLRLPFQPLFIAWALYASGAIDWLRRRSGAASPMRRAYSG